MPRAKRPGLHGTFAAPLVLESCPDRRLLRQPGPMPIVLGKEPEVPAERGLWLPIFETVLNGTKVLGSIVGTRMDPQEVFELHAAGKTHVVYERRQLEDVNTAIHEVETGQVKARLVFDLQ